MDLMVEHDPEQTPVVVLSGELDMANRAQLAACLEQFSGALVVDVAGVTFLDSSSLAVLSETQHRLDGQLRLRNPSPFVRRVLCVTALESWIEDHTSAVEGERR